MMCRSKVLLNVEDIRISQLWGEEQRLQVTFGVLLQ